MSVRSQAAGARCERRVVRVLGACLVAVLLAACVSTDERASVAAADSSPALTLERLLSSPSITGTAPSAPSWSPDSAHLAFLWNDAARAQREIWLVEADGTQPRRLTSASEGATENSAGVREFAWVPDVDALVYLRGVELWRCGLDGMTQRLAADMANASDLAVSPDARFVSFLRGADLWLVELGGGVPVRATTVGLPSISKVALGRYRRPEVEIGPYVWGGPTYAWSPDARTIAVHHVDRRELRAVSFPHYLGEDTDPNFVRRAYPGDPNSRRSVGLLDVESGALSLLNLPEPTATRVVDFSWSAQGRLLIDRESDTAVDRWLHVVEPAVGEPTQLWHDRRETRVYTAAGSAWHPDGEQVFVLGDLAERYGLYLLGAEGAAPRLLTDPAFDVTSAPLVAGSALFYQSNEPSPYERHVFRTALDGGEAQRLTTLAGESRPFPSPDGRRVALLHSSDDQPTELFLVDADGSSPARRITRSPPPEFTQRAWATARYVSFPSLTDDAVLHARILGPAQLEPGRRYPVLVGPAYSNTVRNRWAGRWGSFQQLLVDRGYLVVQVDVRGSTGYGRAFREDFLGDFAGRDLDDLESAVAHLESLPQVDPDRIGIWGSSYGGTLTVYALLKKPGLFDAGVACAAAVDPRFFGSDDVAIVRDPDSAPETFLRGASQYAANLEDPLLLIHGMQDQVVPFKTVVDLAEALIRAGKDFDFAFAPAATHGWTSSPDAARYLFGKLLDHFDRHLAP